MQKTTFYHQQIFLISYFPTIKNNLDLALNISSKDSYSELGQILEGYSKEKRNQLS